MPLRVCSILGTLLLALSVTSPAFAKKKKGDDSSESSSSAKKSKKGKKGDDKAESSDSAASTDKPAADTSSSDSLGAGSSEPQETAEPSSWERPPEEKEKPAGPPPAPPEKPKGSDRPISASISLGWGFMTDRQTNNIQSAANPYQLGGSLRGGYSFDFHLYVGVYFTMFLGSSESGTSQAINTVKMDSSARYMQFGADVGYDWWVGPVIVRPSLQIGEALAFATLGNVHKTVGDFMVGPGISVVHPWDNVFLGGEGRFLIVTGDGVAAFLLAATFGLRFE